MNDVYAVVKRYEQNGNEFADWEFKFDDYYGIFNKVMELTDDYKISEDVASWCELAVVGEIYEFSEGEIEIMEID